MESSRFSESLRHYLLRLRELRAGPTVFALVVAVAATWVIVAVAGIRDPEDTVEDFLTAVADNEVEDALELVTHVDYGEAATFLTPEAINDDWRVESVTEISRDKDTDTAEVEAVIAGPGGTSSGVFTVYDDLDEGWLLREPFVAVTFPDSPLSYIQVNDKIVDRNRVQYKLFPGLYHFYRTVPGVVTAPEPELVAAFPRREPVMTPKEIQPGRLTAGKKPVAKVQRQLEALIDDCAGFTTEIPYGDCPFATDGEIDTPDGKLVTDLHSLTWTVEKHPVVELTDDQRTNLKSGFALRVTEPGTVTLTGNGADTDGNPSTFTVSCAIDMTGAEATLDVDGTVRIDLPSREDLGDDLDTCRQNT